MRRAPPGNRKTYGVWNEMVPGGSSGEKSRRTPDSLIQVSEGITDRSRWDADAGADPRSRPAPIANRSPSTNHRGTAIPVLRGIKTSPDLDPRMNESTLPLLIPLTRSGRSSLMRRPAFPGGHETEIRPESGRGLVP